LSGAGSFGVLNVRVRAALAQLLTSADFARLMRAESSTAFANALAATAYGEYLVGSDLQEISSRRLGYQMRKRIPEKFKLFRDYAPQAAGRLIDVLFRLYELDNLKVVLRGINLGDKWQKVLYLLFPMGEFKSLPFQAMVETADLGSAIALTAGSEYYEPMRAALPRVAQEGTLFSLEVALDLNYWTRVWSLTNALKGSDRSLARELIAVIIERNDLIWAVRYARFHHLNEAEIINYTLGFSPKVPDSLLIDIANGSSLYDLLPRIYPDIQLEPRVDDMTYRLNGLEVALQRREQSLLRNKLSAYPFSIGGALAYLFLLEDEVRDLTMILEAVSLGLSRSSYQPYLISIPAAQAAAES